jgi:hypothetical protein
MKFPFHHFFFVLLLLNSGSLLHAQLTIANDPRECLTGLKDSAGNWVVPPRYTLIEQYNGLYKIHAGDKEGLMSWYGKLLVPAVYDKAEPAYYQFPGVPESELTPADQQLRSRYYSYFLITDNARGTGLAGPGGREIIPPLLLSITNFFNGIAIGITPQNQSVLIDTAGIRCTLPADCFIAPEERSFVGNNRFVVSKRIPDQRGTITRYGVCNERGIFVLPPVYENIHRRLWRMEAIVADSSAGHCGIFSLTGKQLSSCRYRMEKTPDTDEYTLNDFAFVSYNGKRGVIGRRGSVIVPCAYDSISITGKSMHETLFLAHTGKHQDVYSDTKPILINHTYDEVRIAKRTLYAMDPFALLLVRKDQKWGALATSLQEYMPVQFDTVFAEHYYLLFYSDSSVRALYPEYADARVVIVPAPKDGASVPQNNLYEPYLGYNDTIGQIYQSEIHDYSDTTAPVSKVVYWQLLAPVYGFSEIIVHDVWTADSVHLIWELPVELRELPACVEHNYNHDVPSCFAVVHTGKNTVARFDAYKAPGAHELYISTQTGNSRIYRTSDGASLVQPSPHMQYYLQRDYWEDTVSAIGIYTATGKRGAMDLNGRMIIDTLWYGYEQFGHDTFWVATMPPEGDDECAAAWNLYSYSQQKLLLSTKEQFLAVPSLGAGAKGAVLTPTGVGLFDSKTLRFLIAPVYQYIYPLDDSFAYFLVTDFKGVTRLTDQRGKAVIKSPVERATLINKKSGWYGNDPVNDSFLLYSISTAESTLISGNSGVHNYSSLNRDSLFYFLPLQRGAVLHNTSWFDLPYLVLDSTLSLMRWHREFLCDLLVLHSADGDYRGSTGIASFSGAFDRQSDIHCASWPVERTVQFESGRRAPAYVVAHAARNVLCIKTRQGKYRTLYSEYSTYFLRDSVPVKQELADLFANGQWKPVIINALLARLDSQPQIRANCTDADRYPELLANRFLVTSDSLLLFPDWQMDHYLDNPEICVAVAWKELTPFLNTPAKNALEIR